SYNWFVESGVKLSTHENDLTIHITTTDHAKWDDIADSGVKYTWVYQSIKDSGNEWYAAYKHSANSSLHSFNVANYITSTNSINRFYPSTTGKATSGSVHNLWNWSSNKSWYANSANVRFRFIESGGTKWVDLTDGGQTTLHSHAGTPSAPGGSFTANIGSDYTYGISGVKFVSSQNISGGRYIGVRISGAKDINNWNGSSWHNSGLIWDNTLSKWKSKASGGAGGATTLDALTDVTITTPLSGQVLTYMQDTAQWVNRLPSMNFNVANVRLLSGQNINLTRFKCPTGKKTYVWQCSIANSGGASISGLKIEILSGNTQLNTWGSIYKTSSNIVQQGYPLAKSAIDSNIEIRAMYSGSHKYGSQANQVQYCTAFAQVSIY
ncbi:MAG: hypothetical protein IMZ59_02155, partial [Actinobacteria bacterium]|nr:hypothetical protein [Actinomycetota bacterium]